MKKLRLIFTLIILGFCRYNSAQIPNADFELWDPTDSFDVPSSWTVNNFGVANSKTYKQEDAYSGSYSVSLYMPTKNRIYLSTGFNIDYHPHVLNGWYHGFVLSIWDSLLVKVILYNNKISVDSGLWLFDQSSVSDWSPFVVDISQNSAVADSASISVQCIKNGFAATFISLYVDQLFFDDDSSIPSIESSQFNIFPNPASNVIYINSNTASLNNATISIKNNFGQTLVTKKTYTPNSSLNISSLSAGIYFLEIKNEETIIVRQFIKI
ncbi:MAG: T9SS type A sorting domain-containing protein [Chitinophagales bacterium]|nr:T9SS type A sorting domain-containing protein [Chitinophagales bacterium]